MKPLRFSLGLLAALTCLSISPMRLQAGRATVSQPDINIILWFDTEDYLLPASDDSAKRIAQILTERGIRATFKVVGEKARVLERRGRTDVIRALQKHAIGYHANFHSVHPTPSEYLADCDWLDGVAEFIRREGRGAADVRRVFHRRTLACYGQPGSSWASQAIGALPAIGVASHGVPCYLDEGTHVGLNHQPFWYAGALVVYDMGPNLARVDLYDPAALPKTEDRVQKIIAHLRHAYGGGLISIYYHPCEFVHQKFWDGVNFAHGANPPRKDWRKPPQRPARQTEAAFKQFTQYIDFLRALPGVRFITAEDLPLVYPDKLKTDGISREELADLLDAHQPHTGAFHPIGENGSLDFRLVGGMALSVADDFELLTRTLAGAMTRSGPIFPMRVHGLLGPDHPPPAHPWTGLTSPSAFFRSIRDVLDYLQTNHRVPPRVFLGANAVDPRAFLVAMAGVTRRYLVEGRLPTNGSIEIGQAPTLLPAQHIAKDSPSIFGDWIIHKPGFRAPHILQVARLQAWTLKPALPAKIPSTNVNAGQTTP